MCDLWNEKFNQIILLALTKRSFNSEPPLHWLHPTPIYFIVWFGMHENMNLNLAFFMVLYLWIENMCSVSEEWIKRIYVDGTSSRYTHLYWHTSLSINLLEVDVYVFIYLWLLRVIWKLCKRASVYTLLPRPLRMALMRTCAVSKTIN